MITKILFTAAVIALAYLYVQGRKRTDAAAARPKPSLPSSPATKAPGADKLPRYLAYAFLGIMLAGSGLFIFMEWQDSYRVVTVKVINTYNGKSVTYEARRGDIDGRSFETIDGRRVTLADVERMELGGR